MKTMLFNPYSGKPRHPSDIQSDPAGILMIDPDEPIRAYTAPPKAQPMSDEQLAVLIECRYQAMKWTAVARIPEAGAFGGIAQDLDWLCDQLATK